jgi:hypothetical protein
MKWVALILACIFFLTAFLILFQQYVVFGVFFEFDDALHHESFAMSGFALGIGILISAGILWKNKNK